MPTLRNKVNKRKSDSFVLDNAKSRKIASGTVIKRNVQVPVTVQLKSLKEAHEALLKVNEENLKEIEDLKLQVALLVHERSLQPELQEPVKSIKKCKESQTETHNYFKCTKCIYEANSEEELKIHVKREHSSGLKVENYSCNLCSETFGVRWELMIHKKNEHPLYLKTCTFFEQGNCAFGDECWFRHTQTGQGSFLPQTLKEFKCGFCEKIFERKKSFMEHRKLEHVNHVLDCSANKNGSCRYGSQECWFKHQNNEANNDHEEISGIKTVDLVKRLFDMMEAFAERISKMENQM